MDPCTAPPCPARHPPQNGITSQTAPAFTDLIDRTCAAKRCRRAGVATFVVRGADKIGHFALHLDRKRGGAPGAPSPVSGHVQSPLLSRASAPDDRSHPCQPGCPWLVLELDHHGSRSVKSNPFGGAFGCGSRPSALPTGPSMGIALAWQVHSPISAWFPGADHVLGPPLLHDSEGGPE